MGELVTVAWARFPCPSCGTEINTTTETPGRQGSALIVGVLCACGLSFTVEIAGQQQDVA